MAQGEIEHGPVSLDQARQHLGYPECACVFRIAHMHKSYLQKVTFDG
jgi:hypothetical protein